MQKKLNLGCGEFKKKGYVNVDYYSVSAPDIKHDLNAIPYPFKRDYFDVVEADHVLEHLDNPFNVMKEIHRISKDSATVTIKVPHFSRGFTHPEHKRGFDVSFPLYFDPSFQGGYQGVAFKAKNVRLRWMSTFSTNYLKNDVLNPVAFFFLKAYCSIVNFFANLSPSFTSRFWCYIVGGFEEIEFDLVVRKG